MQHKNINKYAENWLDIQKIVLFKSKCFQLSQTSLGGTIYIYAERERERERDRERERERDRERERERERESFPHILFIFYLFSFYFLHFFIYINKVRVEIVYLGCWDNQLIILLI